MSTKVSRPKNPVRRRRVPRKPVVEAFGYAELVNTINQIKAMRDQFNADFDNTLERANVLLQRHIKETKKGDRGIPGPRGPQGRAIVGPQGPRGAEGPQGKPGRDGKTLNIDTVIRKVTQALEKKILAKVPKMADIVKAVLQKIKGSITIDDIQNLRQELRSAQNKTQAGGAGGGGMGNFVPFALDGDGSTTEFTLPAEPTQEGLAILCHYQGQWLQPATHYMVSGKTITFTFTPDDTTVLEGLLIT